ncbi:Panacea domain-containing protein [Roseateles noduli]|uniref:Panacea domain-containing protein n=1 Tax=Roseateles noduli TaxID=2052484 RepID=UPI003D64647F
MPSTAKKISEYILAHFLEIGDPITTAKLHKLLYYVQGWHLAHFQEPAFEDRIEAWMHGPTCPAIEQLYDGHWHVPIVKRTPPPEDLGERLQKLVEEILEIYGEDTGYALHQRTRNEPPWNEARKGLSRHDDSCTAVISHASMQRFFAAEGTRQEVA